MKISTFRLKRLFICLMPLSCLFFVCCFAYIKDYDGPELPTSQIAKIYLDKSWWGQYTWNYPVSAEIDGKPHEMYKDPAPCILVLPGEHEIALVGGTLTYKSVSPEQGPIIDGVMTRIIIEQKILPKPPRHIFKLNAEKGGEYLVVQDRHAGDIEDYLILWIVDKASKKRISEEFRFDWKRLIVP